MRTFGSVEQLHPSFKKAAVKSMPFAIQLSLILFLVLIIPFIALMTYTVYSTLRYSEEEIARNALESIEVNRRFTENFMNNISSSILRFVADHEFLGYVGLQKYGAIQGNVDNGIKVQKLQKELLSIEKNEGAIHSIFLLFDGADYVISTDRGVVELLDYYSLSWLRTVSAQKRGLGGVWVPRELQSSTLRDIMAGHDRDLRIPVISYVYSLNRLTTAIGGTIVINIRESALAENLNPGRTSPGPYGNILLQRDGKIISHPDGSNFLLQGRNLPRIAAILDNGNKRGYEISHDGGLELLYTYLKTDYSEWVYISIQSMAALLRRSALMIRNMILLSVSAVLAGTMISLGVFFRISRPMRQLVNGLKESTSLPAGGNEMKILSAAFSQIEEKGRQLQELLAEREKDTALLVIRNILSGDNMDRQEPVVLARIFPYKLFRVAVAVLDNYAAYRRRTNTEQRAYHRYLFISAAEAAPPHPLILRGARYYEGQIALIINIPEGYDRGEGKDPPGGEIRELLQGLKEQARSIFGTTITIGLSQTGLDPEGVHNCALQGAEAALGRMVRGGDSIIPWQDRGLERKRFYYPQKIEDRILNYLDAGNLAHIKTELGEILKAVGSMEDISYDNICFIYNQLAGVTIRRLSEMNINTVRFFSEHGGVYNAIASCETLEQINSFMVNFYEDILEYLRRDEPEEERPIDRILQFFEQHYREDMFFEDMAARLGLSYSYMRKIVREATGQSVLDTINRFRIREAKNLLADRDVPVSRIAESVGYRNVQSLTRFFKKFEGLTPLEYRLANRHAARDSA
jgi:AraC-like DNA-binding protein